MASSLVAALALALTAAPGVKAAPVSLPGTYEMALKSAAGRDYRIMISEPTGPAADEQGYRVIYVLDGNAFFGLFHDTKRLEDDYADTIIVSVGYPTDKPYDLERRDYDLTPPAPGETPPQGGEEELLDFLQKRLMPAIAARYKVGPDQQSLFGHSFGGMFALHTMFTRPGLFAHYVAASPTLWWRDRYLLSEERAFTEKVRQGAIDVRKTSVLIAFGNAESPQEIQDAELLERRLEGLSGYGLRTAWLLQPGEHHMSLTPAIVTQVLRDLLTARTR